MGPTSWPASLADPPTTETSPRGWFNDLSGKRRAVVLSIVAITGLAAVFGLGSLFMRWRYGTWPWAKYPSAMHYCGATYNRTNTTAVPRVFNRDLGEEVAEPIYPVFTYDAPLVSSHAVFADTARGDHVGDSTECASFLFIKTTPRHVLAYRIDDTSGPTP
jgi:hypothetical protein